MSEIGSTLTELNALINGNKSSDYADANKINKTGCFLCRGDMANIPVSAGILLNFRVNYDGALQIFVTHNGLSMYQRVNWGVWSNWVSIK